MDDWYSYKILLATFKEVYPYSYILPAFNKVGAHVLGSSKPIDCSLEKIKEKLAVTSVAQDIFPGNIGIYSRLSSKVSKTITPGNHFKIHSSNMLKLTPASCYNPQFFF